MQLIKKGSKEREWRAEGGRGEGRQGELRKERDRGEERGCRLRRLQGAVHYPPPSLSEIRRGPTPLLWIFTVITPSRLLTWNRSSMTTDRLAKLERMAMHPKRLASISNNSILNAVISSGPRKLNYRKNKHVNP